MTVEKLIALIPALPLAGFGLALPESARWRKAALIQRSGSPPSTNVAWKSKITPLIGTGTSWIITATA